MIEGLIAKPCKAEEQCQWVEFLNKNFDYPQGQNYAVDFAPLFDPAALERSTLVWKENQIVASATLYPITALAGGKMLDLAIIGAVATDERFRGQGLSRQVLAQVENEARAAGIQGLVLWSDKADFYAKLGFEPAGKQLVCSLEGLERPESLAPGAPAYGWDWSRVRFLYSQHPMRVMRSRAHWQSLERIQSCTRVQWLDPEGRTVAYLGFDRGKDLHGIAHEWGGDPHALHCLVWTVLQNRPELMWLTHPNLDDPILPLISGPKETFGALALVKAFNDDVSVEDFEEAWFWGLDSL